MCVRKILLVLTVIVLFCSRDGLSQKISNKFNPVIKGTPTLEIDQHTDGNYLIFGAISYYENEHSGSLIKVDNQGQLISSFKKVFTNRPIDKIVVLPSGKILIQGDFTSLNGVRTGNMALLNSDGSVDENFTVDTDINILDFIVQSTGKIVIGYNTAYIKDIAFKNIARINADGSLDNSYSNMLINDLWKFRNGSADKFYVRQTSRIYRIMPDGSIDVGFDFPTSFQGSILDFVIQPDDKVILSVTRVISFSPFTTESKLERYNPDGTIDNTFNSTIDDLDMYGIQLRKDGKITAIGNYYDIGNLRCHAFELMGDGTFNRELLGSDFNKMKSIFEDASEQLFVTGSFIRINNNPEHQNYVAKVNTDYQIDSNFKVSVSGAGTETISMGIQHDGKLVVGGSLSSEGVMDDPSKLTRLGSDGMPDLSFTPAISASKLRTAVHTLAVQSDDRIVVSGADLFDDTAVSFGRLLPDGEFDNSFQAGTGPTDDDGAPRLVEVLKIHDSKIYVLGRFTKFNGEVRNSFVILDENGTIVGPEKNTLPANSSIDDMEIQSDGGVVLMGYFPGIPKKFLRLNVDGSIDETFGLDLYGDFTDLEIDHDDNIFVTGYNLDIDYDNVVLKFTPDGLPDNSFDINDRFGAETFVTVNQIKVLEDNTLLVAGQFDTYDGNQVNGVLFIDPTGAFILVENNFNPGSLPLSVEHSNRVSYVLGRFSESDGEIVKSGIKILYPIVNSITDYQVNAISDSEMQLNWSGSFSGAEFVTVEKLPFDQPDYETVTTILPDATSYSALSLDEATPYYFRITGANELYTSVSVEAKDTTFIKPQLALPASDVNATSFLANWMYEPGTDSCQLQISNDHFVSVVPGYENLIVKSGSFPVEGLSNNVLYQYRVRRFKNGIASEYSDAIEVQIIVGVEDESQSIVVFPNPAHDYIIIQQNVPLRKVTFFSPDGSVAKSFDLNATTAKLNIQNLSRGIFLVNIISADNSVRQLRISKPY